MAEPDRDLEPVIIDLSRIPLSRLPALDDELVAEAVRRLKATSENGSRLWSVDEDRP